MSELSRNLRRELSDEFPEGNPLVAIGVSAHILDLGLSADELFDYITKDVARRLILRFHTDRGGFTGLEDVALLRGRLAEAYRQLQDRQTFDKALVEFRNLKAEERSEMRVLRTSLEVTREKLASYTSKEVEISEGTRRLGRDREILDRTKVAQARVVPGLEGDIKRLEKKVTSLENSLSHYRRMHRGLTRYISFLSDDRPATVRGVHVFEAKWVAIVSLVPFQCRQESAPAFDVKRKWTADFRKAVGPLSITEEELVRIRKRWFTSLPQLKEPLASEFRATFWVRLHIFSITGGKLSHVFGWKRACDGWAMGSVPEGPSPFARSALAYRQFGENVVENLVPFLVPGSLLVTQQIKKITKDPQDWNREFPLTTRETKHIILGTG